MKEELNELKEQLMKLEAERSNLDNQIALKRGQLRDVERKQRIYEIVEDKLKEAELFNLGDLTVKDVEKVLNAPLCSVCGAEVWEKHQQATVHTYKDYVRKIESEIMFPVCSKDENHQIVVPSEEGFTTKDFGLNYVEYLLFYYSPSKGMNF